ncbi:chorion-specific transcription factor GCMa-like protein [Willisornis vidua]|uniref:Chorion-specific transcription factor GCMa-like protein n=1 Tax=Willisornis vidua TaxID=1566151 RepID=A0ABQ9CJL5_9PASS|nr:chorion-specific transcription factor GCMa-like protein [Willisornis vidua]
MPEELPLLLSKPDAYLLPAHFRGHLSKSSQELTLSSCSGQPPYSRAAGQDGGSRKELAWSRSPSLGRMPNTERLCGVPAVPCTAPSFQHCAHLSTQHVLPVTKGVHGAFRPDTGPLGDGSYGEKSLLTYSSSCLSLLPYPAAQGGPCPMARGAQPQSQLLEPPRGREGDRANGGPQVGPSYCDDDMFSNLYPLR